MTRRSGGFKPPVSANFTTRAGVPTQAIHPSPIADADPLSEGLTNSGFAEVECPRV
jgi:hypothetical protein